MNNIQCFGPVSNLGKLTSWLTNGSSQVRSNEKIAIISGVVLGIFALYLLCRHFSHSLNPLSVKFAQANKTIKQIEEDLDKQGAKENLIKIENEIQKIQEKIDLEKETSQNTLVVSQNKDKILDLEKELQVKLDAYPAIFSTFRENHSKRLQHLNHTINYLLNEITIFEINAQKFNLIQLLFLNSSFSKDPIIINNMSEKIKKNNKEFVTHKATFAECMNKYSSYSSFIEKGKNLI